MQGLMQAQQLTTAMLIRHAATNHPRREIVSRGVDGSLTRSNWQTVERHARHIAASLADLGLRPGDRVATLAWNRLPHLELYYGVSGAGMVLHTVNPRLFPEQIRYIIDHGGARLLCVDPDLIAIIEPMLGDLPKIEHVVILSDQADTPASSIADPISYQSLIAGPRAIEAWPDIDENCANALCYTSGTTGDPKGVLYSHRSTVLHAMSALANDSMSLGAADSILVVTPLFHVNAWGIPYSAAMAGAKLVLPGSALDPVSLFELMRDEDISFSLGVPTIWFAFLDYLERECSPEDRAGLQLNRIFTGGAATPRSLIERFRDLLDVETVQAWGMTETSPVATVCRPLAHHADLPEAAQIDLRAMQGRAVFGMELRIENEDGMELPRDGEAAGLLKVRGPWVLNAYEGQPTGSALDAGGWFDTGDVAKIDPDGFLQITDRAKDVIKSGGEWISSIDLENAAVAHAKVAEAAVIGVAHPKWQERPLLLVRPHPGETCTKDEIVAHLTDKVARWWLPDDIIFVDELPHTATGKLLKTELRKQYGDHFGAANGALT
ncbi:long-chain fatty acid--CoA ligase [Sphingopyxis lindanitolerans]|uniref:3-methylmercaptopropionyl-CoA ligase n=1 Tax=Sphingopyxis lindanitolerans TaxID=2054227 RepID=A0A2S8B8V5_9SPHN|nr:long-chain fatty acid--CoA ligase [Sphingopyxis lindanitolerans]PQM28841.1 long-chain fatty acid--CoA ligase [Sphingopyxis lindanitolerans]